MKKLLYTLLLFLSIFCYGQENEYKKAVVLYNAKNYTETIAVSEKILIGNPNPIIKVYASYMIADSYKSLENYSQAYIKFKDYLDILNNSNSFSKKDLEKAKANIETIIADLQTKISNDENKEIKNNNQITSNSESSDSKIKAVETNIITDAKVESKNINTELESTKDKSVEITKPIPNEKTVSLTVSGTGKTLEEARLNALRSAIEQAFGAFISSKTEILSDNLVKDEIVSISNGNVQKYDIVSQVEIPNVGYAITLNATVSIDKLTTFAESKGVVIEFKGGMFGATIKLQKLNEESEYVAIKNLLVQTLTILESTYNYSLKVNEPKLIEGDKYSILFEVSANSNDNYVNLWNFFKKTIRQISLNEADALAIETTGKKIWYLQVDNENLKLRNRKSLEAFFNFSMLSSLIASNSFYLKNNLETVKIENQRALLFESKTGSYYPKSYSNLKNYNGDDDMWIYSQPEQIVINDAGIVNNFLDYIKTNKFDINNLLNLKLIAYEYFTISLKDNNNRISIMTPFSFQSHFNEDNKILKYTLNYKLSDLEKINSFEIKKCPFIELMNNYELYRIIKERQSFSCFLKGTKIKTPQGSKLIENVKVGDEVVCFDDKGKLHTSIVESINSHENQDVYKYNVWNNDALYATPNHWALTSENSFTEIGKLNEMLTLVDIDGGFKPITKVEYFGKEKVYNFIVKDYHTYIANEIRVHNGGKGKFKLKL